MQIFNKKIKTEAPLKVYDDTALQKPSRGSEQDDFNRTFDPFPDPCILHSGEIILRINRAAERFTRLDDPQSIIGRSLLDFIHPDSREIAGKRLQLLYEDQKPLSLAEEKFINGQGETRDVEIISFPVLYGDKQVIQSVFRDITSRKKTEQDLRDSEERFRSLIESTSDFIWEVDSEARYTYVSPQVKEMLGYKAEDMLGKTPFDFMPAEEAKRIKKLFSEHKRAKAPFRNLQNANIHKSGRLVILETNGAPVLDEKGRLTGFRGIDRDITERRQTEETLLQTEANYKRLVNNSLTGIYITQKHIMKFCNQKMAEIFGYENADEIIGMHIKNLVAPGNWEIVDHEVNLRISGQKETSRYEFVGLKKDGSHFHAEVLGSRIFLNKKPAMQGTIVDITERKRTEDALRKSEQRYHQLFDFLPYGGEILDTDGYIIDCSSSSIRALGYSKEEMIGKHITAFFDKSCVHLYDENFPLIKQGKFISKEIKMVTKDGKILNMLRAGQPIFDKKSRTVIGILALNVDITERKNAEREMMRLATVVEQASEVIVITDTSGTIQYVNPAFEKVTGYTAEEALSQNPRILKSDLQDDDFYKDLWETIAKGEKWQGTFVNKKKNGDIYYEEAAIFPIRDETGQVVNYAAIKKDITQERELEQQLKQMQKMEALGTLSGGVAHDFNNLLTIINGHAEIALLHTPEGERAHTDLVAIMNAGKRAENLISQLLAFSRRQLHEPKVIDINHVISDLKKMLRRLIPEDISIETRLSGHLPNIKADHSQIEQILINLVVNARDAIIEKIELGSEKNIQICTSSVTLDKSFVESHPGSHQGEHILITVGDTGTGMDKTILNRIFEPFFTTKEIHKGTGLGLATVYGIVKQNDGYIDVDSVKGQGTTCKIYWPATGEKASPEMVQLLKHKALAGNETILLVEDDEGVREFTASTLKNFGYTVIEATNGRKAIDLITDQKPLVDLLITDIIMPEMNGQELAENLKDIIPMERVLFVSGYTFDHLKRDDALEKGVNYLQKPYSIHDILTKIRELLNQ